MTEYHETPNGHTPPGECPLVICTGNSERQQMFEDAGITARAYEYFRPAREGTWPAWHDPPTPVTFSWAYDYEDYKLEKSLYMTKLEGRRVVILAPRHIGPRENDPVRRVERLFRDEGARVSVIPEEEDVIDAVKNATQTFGLFKRKIGATGGKPEALIDGVLLRGQRHTIFGGPGHGKTMFACYIAAQLVKRGESVVYLDRENGHGRIHERMLALGCTEDELERHFFYFEDPPGAVEDAPDYRQLLAEVDASLVIFDSLFGFLTTAGLSENHGPDLGTWTDAYTPQGLGVATLTLDHPPKAGDSERGTSRKRDVVDVSWHLTGNFDPNRAGPLRLRLKKSRDGELDELASFTFGGTPLRAERGDARRLKPEEITEDLLEDGMTAGEWLDTSAERISEATFFRHVKKLEKERRVEKINGRYSHMRVEENEK